MSMKKRRFTEILLSLAVIITALILFNLYGVSGTIPIILTLLSAGFIVFLAWFYKQGPKHIFDKIYISLYIAIYISNLFLQRKAVILIYLIYSLTAAGIGLYKLFANKERFFYGTLFYAIIFFCLFNETDRLVYVNGENYFNTISLIIAVAVGASAAGLLFVKKIELKSPTLANKSRTILILMVLTFVIASGTIKNLNYCLDNSAPETYNAKVITKYSKRKRKSSHTYYLMLKVNNKTYSFKVKKSEFDKTQTNEIIDIYRYKGALSQPYFIQ